MELLTLCRSCMMEVASWELQKFDDDAVGMFTFCTNVEISEDDKLPKQFCCDCKTKIVSSYTFIKKAQEVNVTLINLLAGAETDVVIKSEQCSNIESPLSSDVKINESYDENMFNFNSNRNFEYKMEFDVYQNSPENSENDLEEHNSNVDNFVTRRQNVRITRFSKRDSNCTNKKIRKINKNTKRDKEVPELEKLSKKTYKTRIKKRKSHDSKAIKKSKEKSNGEEKVFICDTCTMSFTTKNRLRNHIVRSKHIRKKDVNKEKGGGTTKDDLSCEFCDGSFTSALLLSKHIRKEHDKRYSCPHCPMTFYTFITYSRHKTSCHESEHDRRFACDECGARFNRGAQLAAHALAQPHARPHVCATCGVAFKTKSHLATHMNSHSDEKPFLCTICGYRTKLLIHLKNHMPIHTGVKAFACKECPFRTKTNTTLLRHALRHRGERRHACQLCDKRFYEPGALARHVRRMHTGERTFHCYMCTEAFFDGWECKTHLVRVHKIPLEDIPRLSSKKTTSKENPVAE